MGLFGLHLPKKADNVFSAIGHGLNPLDGGQGWSSAPVKPSQQSAYQQALTAAYGQSKPPQVNAAPDTRNLFSKIYDQTNLFDNGLTYHQSTPLSSRSNLGMLTHSGLANTTGNFFVKPLTSTINTAVTDPARSLVARATGNRAAELASEKRNAQSLHNSLPGFLIDQAVNSGQSFANLAFKAPIQDLSGNKLGASRTRTAGIQEFNRTMPGMAVRPAQYGIANIVHAPSDKQAQQGLDPTATGAQKYIADPVMGIIGTAGLIHGAGKGLDTMKAAIEGKTPTSSGIQIAREPTTQPTAEVSTTVKPGEISRTATGVPKDISSTEGTPKSLGSRYFDARKYVEEQTQKAKDAKAGETKVGTAKVWQDFKAKTIDALAPIEQPINKALGFSHDVTLQLRNQLDRSLRGKKLAGQFAVDNGLEQIIKNVPDKDAFDQYAIARHAQELEANGVKTGRNAAKDQALINELAPTYEPHFKDLTAYNDKLLSRSVDYGLISQETADYLRQKYPDYVPMERIFSDAELQNKQGNGSGPASLSTQTVVQRIKGSGREIASPLESVAAKTNDVITQGERNVAAKTVVETSQGLKENPLQFRELKPNEVIGNKNTISFIDNGVKRVFETTPEVARAAKNMNPVQLGLWGKVFSYPTRVLRLGATGANVSFALANVVKDTASAFINSEHPVQASLANPRVFLQALDAAFHHGGKNYAELVREGAGGTSFDIARADAGVSVAKIRADRSAGTKIAYTVRHPGELLRAVEDTIGRSEEFGRAVQYFGNKEAALGEGKTLSQATRYGADAARNNTVNFARAGEYGRVLNSAIPYLNAGVQGSRVLLRNLGERPLETGSKIAITAFVPTATATAWNLNDPKRKAAYDSIYEYEKENNIIIVPPNPKQDEQGRWNVIKIPVSQEVANLNNIVRNGVEAKFNDKNFDFKSFAANLTGTATSINAQSPSRAIGQFTPQAAKVPLEVITNRNMFTGQQIVPDSIKNLSPQYQYNKSTSGTARVIGRYTNTSPLMIDNIIRTSTGGLGQNLVHMSDTALNKAGVIPSDQVGGKGVVESVANRFNSAQGATYGTLFFKSIQDEAKKQKLAGKDYELLNALTTKEIDPNGIAIPQNDKDALNNNSILANNPRVAAVRAEAAKKLAAQTGRPVDPLYNLTPQQQEAYYKLNSSIYKGQAYERIAKENKGWLSGFQKERAAYFDKLNVPPPEKSGKVKYPLSSQEKTTLDSYFAITDPVKRGQMLQSNPTISTSLNKLSQYANDKQIAQGSAPLDTYPGSSPQVDRWTKEYFSQPKGSKIAWQRANPGKWASVSQDMTSKALYGLQNEAVAAQYKDTAMSQKGLKDIYNLGQYDIGKQTDANGNVFYALGGQGSSSNFGYGKKKTGISQTLNPISVSVRKPTAIKKPNVRVAVKARSSGGKGGKIKVTSKKLRLA